MSAATASPAAPAVPVSGTASDGLTRTADRAADGRLEILVASVRRAVRAGGDWREVADRVAGVLRRRLPSASLLTGEQLAGDPAGYQVHLLHAEPDGSFSVTVMVWLPGQQTPVHDHLAWCVSAVLQGTEYEEIFAPASATPGGAGGLEVIARNENPAGAVAAFAPPGDIHRVRNTGAGVAVSMHVYGTDISRVGSSVRREYAVLSRAGATRPASGQPAREPRSPAAFS